MRWIERHIDAVALALVTGVFGASYLLPVLPPTEDMLDLDPNAPPMTGWRVVAWCVGMMMASRRALGALAIGVVLAANLGIVAAWVNALLWRWRRATTLSAVIGAAIALGPGVGSAWMGRG